jgi:hypothetical protein
VEADREAAVALLLHQLIGARVPDLDRARAVLALRDLARERRVVERVVLDVDGEMALTRLERDPLRHRPARERTVTLVAEVVVEPARVVALHDEDRLLRLPLAAERLRCLLRIALALVIAKAHEAFLARPRLGPDFCVVVPVRAAAKACASLHSECSR